MAANPTGRDRRMTGSTDPSAAPPVAIVVLNWKHTDTTIACLDALRATDYPNRHVIVVDNESTEATAARLAAIPDITLVCNAVNSGFAGGVNIGITEALRQGAAYVWLLNNDAAPAADALSLLVAAMRADPSIGLASPVFLDPEVPDRMEFCVGVFDPQALYASQTADPVEAAGWQAQHPDRILLLGTALLLSRRLVETIGLLDEQFFAYVEDVDYSLRSLRAGFRNVAVPAARAWHKFKQPTTDPASVPPYLHYFISRNYPLLWRKLPRPVRLTRAVLWFLRDRFGQIARMSGNRAAIDALLAGLWDGLRGVGGPYDPTRRMPALLRGALGRYPGFWIALLDRDPRALGGARRAPG